MSRTTPPIWVPKPLPVALLAVLSCAISCAHTRAGTHGAEPIPLFDVPNSNPTLAALEARAMLNRDPMRAFDIAFVLANDRVLAKEAISAAATRTPTTSIDVRLRHALFALLAFEFDVAARDLVSMVRTHPDANETPLALALLHDIYDESEITRTRIARALSSSSIMTHGRGSPHAVVLATSLLAKKEGPTPVPGPWKTRGGWLTRFRAVGPIAPALDFVLRERTQAEMGPFPNKVSSKGLVHVPRSVVPIGRSIAPIRGGFDGLYVAETYVHIPDAIDSVDAVAHIFLRSLGRVAIDGRTIVERRAVDPPRPAYTATKLRLSAGWHRVTVAMLATASNEFSISLLNENGQPIVADERDAPSSDEVGNITRVADVPYEPVATDVFMRIVDGRAALSSVRRDLECARAQIRPLARTATTSATLRVLMAQLFEREGLPSSRVEAELRRALMLHPLEPYALVVLAAQLPREQHDEALALVDRAERAIPGAAILDALRFRKFRARGWNAEAETSLKRAIEKEPTRQLLEEGARFFDEQKRPDDASRLRAKAGALSRRSAEEYLFSRSISEGKIDRAIDILKRDPARRRDPGARFSQAAELELARGDANAALQTAKQALVFDSDSPQAWRANVLAAHTAGDRTGAKSAAHELIRRTEPDFDLERFAHMLDGVPAKDLADAFVGLLRHPTLRQQLTYDAVAAAMAPDPPSFQHDKRIILLDRNVDVVRPDGAAIRLHHKVVRLLTKQATDMQGELRLPTGALPLELRTIKGGDGQTVDIDRHAGKADVSFSALAPGDLVEEKWLAPLAPRVDGGYSRVLVFQSEDPRLKTEFVVVAPKDAQVRWQAYHGAPEPTIFEEAGDTVLVFRASETSGLAFEPNAPPHEEFLPFVMVAVNFDVEHALDVNADRLGGVSRTSFDVREAALQIARGIPDLPDDTPEAKALAVFKWIVKNIEPGAEEDPTRTLLMGEGNRAGLFCAVLRELGPLATVVLAREGVAAQLDPPLADPARFTAPLVRIPIAHGAALWAELSSKAPWFGKAPASFRGGSYLVHAHNAKPHVERFLDNEVERWPIRSKVELDVDASGDAHGRLTLVFTGQIAQAIRVGFAQQRTDERLKRAQAWLGRLIAGSRITRFSTDTFEDGHELDPLTVTAEMDVPGFFAATGRELKNDDFFSDPIGLMSFGAKPFQDILQRSERKTPLLLEETMEHGEIVVRFISNGVTVVEAPRNVQRRSPHLLLSQSFSFDAAAREARLVYARSTELARISREQYPEIRRDAQDALTQTRNRLVVIVP